MEENTMSYADLISNLISENKALTQANERLKAENEKLLTALEEIKKRLPQQR